MTETAFASRPCYEDPVRPWIKGRRALSAIQQHLINKYSLVGFNVSLLQLRSTSRTVLIVSTDVRRPTSNGGGAPSENSSDFKRAKKGKIIRLCSLDIPSCPHNFSEIRTSISKQASVMDRRPGTPQEPSRFSMPDWDC